jgi:hypothetical protein
MRVGDPRNCGSLAEPDAGAASVPIDELDAARTQCRANFSYCFASAAQFPRAMQPPVLALPWRHTDHREGPGRNPLMVATPEHRKVRAVIDVDRPEVTVAGERGPAPSSFRL